MQGRVRRLDLQRSARDALERKARASDVRAWLTSGHHIDGHASLRTTSKSLAHQDMRCSPLRPVRAVIRRAQCCAAASTSSASDLLTWVHSNGGSVSSAVRVSIPDPVTGFGLTASRVGRRAHAYCHMDCMTCTDNEPRSCTQACEAGERLISLPRQLQLTYDGRSSPALLQLISRVPEELWGARLALQVMMPTVLQPLSMVWPCKRDQPGNHRMHAGAAGAGPGAGQRLPALHQQPAGRRARHPRLLLP